MRLIFRAIDDYSQQIAMDRAMRMVFQGITTCNNYRAHRAHKSCESMVYHYCYEVPKILSA